MRENNHVSNSSGGQQQQQQQEEDNSQQEEEAFSALQIARGAAERDVSFLCVKRKEHVSFAEPKNFDVWIAL